MGGSFSLEDTVDVGSVKVRHRRITVRHAENACATMVVKHDKHVVIGAAGDDLFAAVRGGCLLGSLTIQSAGVASKHSQNVGGGNIVAGVVLGHSGVDVRQNLGVVDDGALVRILWVIGNVVIVEDNDVGIGHAILLHNLVGMVDVSLVAVISVRVGPGDEKDPVETALGVVLA